MSKKKGFTLIELIVVIAIIGILAAITLPRLSSYSDNAIIAKNAESAHNVANACMAYILENNVTASVNPSAEDLAPFLSGGAKIVSGLGKPNTNSKWGHFQWNQYKGNKDEVMCVHIIFPGGFYPEAGVPRAEDHVVIIVEMYDPTIQQQHNSNSTPNIRYHRFDM